MKNWILAGVLAFILCMGCGDKIRLPHGYTWKTTEPNQSEIVAPSGQVVLSGYLSLWGKYPFVYGNGDGRHKEFVLNLQTSEIIFFDSSNDFNSFLKAKNLPLFYTPESDCHQTTINNVVALKDSKSAEFMRNMKCKQQDSH